MTDLSTNPPPAGHNNPPPFDPAALDACRSKAREFIDAGGDWMDLGDIQTDEQSARLTDYVSGLRKVYQQVEAERKAQKKPHDDAGKAVTAAFSPLLDAMERVLDRMKPMQERWLRKKQVEAQAEQKRLKDEADAKLRLAESQAAAAMSRNDVLGEIEAERLRDEAAKLAKTASAPVSMKASSATGGGRSMSLREVRSGQITNINQVFLHFRDTPEVLDCLQRLVDAAFRAKGGETVIIPGATLVTKQVAA